MTINRRRVIVFFCVVTATLAMRKDTEADVATYAGFSGQACLG
jgi:hypothetical protein